VTEAVRSSVAPAEVVPMAMNWVDCPGDATDWEPGMMASEVRVLVVGPVPLPVTVMVAALLVIRPPKPCVLAVIVVVPGPTPVTTPALTVATDVALEFQLTAAVMSWLVEGWLP